ncbi:spermine/spermidine synthase domain-containing protein [Methylocaldum sp. MU1018]
MAIRKYGGVLVHCSRDEFGIIEVVDTYGVRSLHFGTHPKQSAMSLVEPDHLELSYARAMLAGLLFKSEPRKILLLGLGGGSLAKFLFDHFPECRIEAVEYRPAVVEVAYEYFGLPEDSRLTVHVSESNEFVCAEAERREAEYDHIFVDVFDHQGMAETVNQQDFFSASRRLLHPEGILSMNLWGTQSQSLRQSMGLLNLYFERRTMRLQVPGRGNVIGFGLGPHVQRTEINTLKQEAKALELLLGIEFPRFLRLLSYSGWR